MNYGRPLQSGIQHGRRVFPFARTTFSQTPHRVPHAKLLLRDLVRGLGVPSSKRRRRIATSPGLSEAMVGGFGHPEGSQTPPTVGGRRGGRRLWQRYRDDQRPPSKQDLSNHHKPYLSEKRAFDTSVRNPDSAEIAAAVAPAGPLPTTITSYLVKRIRLQSRRQPNGRPW